MRLSQWSNIKHVDSRRLYREPADDYGESADGYIPTYGSSLETADSELELADSSADSYVDPTRICVLVRAFKDRQLEAECYSHYL